MTEERKQIENMINSGHIFARNLVKRFGGLDSMTDEEVMKACRRLHIKVKSAEEKAYETFMSALSRHNDAQRSIAMATEAHLNEMFTAEIQDTESCKAVIAETMDIMRNNYELANEWYSFTNHGATLYSILK